VKRVKAMKRLVIVESPTKVRTLGRILGGDYTIKASKGHVRDLLKSSLSVDVENDFKPTYRILREKRDVVKELRKAVKKADEVYLATDPDREGEAIAWHLTFAAKIPKEKARRVAFHEITPPAVKEAFAHPRGIDMQLVNAQQARRILDRLVGYELSPLLWKKVKGGLSAGRVQSVALRMIVEREREIAAFVPEEYWTIQAELAKREKERRSFIAELIRIRGEKFRLGSEEEAQRVVEELKRASYVVAEVRRQKKKRRPKPPFKTSTMQQRASSLLHFSPARTMQVAQQLYEGVELGKEGQVGLITYMRTDSLHVAETAQREARQFIARKYGEEFIPEKLPQYKSKGRTQEAHEAIRPTSVWRVPELIKGYLTRDQFLLYELIWKRFLASQMAPAILDTTSVDVIADRRLEIADDESMVSPQQLSAVSCKPDYLFRATGSVIIFPGFLVLYPEALQEQKGQVLPPLSVREVLDLVRLVPEQHFTKPPPRYSEASLVKAMEEAGIGRPSTYAPIISIIQKRGYVEKENEHLVPTELGFVVNDLLVEHFPRIVDVNFTARMEEQLDQIAAGELEWVGMLREFWEPFKQTLRRASERMKKIEVQKPTGERCPECGAPLVVKWGRYGKFIGCSNFPRCKFTKPYLKPTGAKCPKCGGELVERKTKRGRTFYGCSNWPDCDFAIWQKPLPQPCPSCGGLMVVKEGRAECIRCGFSQSVDQQTTKPVGSKLSAGLQGADDEA